MRIGSSDRVDSHSSLRNNDRVQVMLFKIDAAGSVARNTLHLNFVMAYFNELEQLCINVAEILPNLDKVEKVRISYRKILGLIESDDKCRTRRALRLLLDCCTEYNLLLVSGLQKMHYFFRLSKPQRKGLKNMSEVFSESIFRGEKDESKELSEEED